MDTHSIAYYAGFFDGEGYVGNGFRGRMEVRIVNTYRPILDEICSKYGGHVYERKKSNTRHRTAYELAIVGQEDVERFLSDIYPHLREKKKRVDALSR